MDHPLNTVRYGPAEWLGRLYRRRGPVVSVGAGRYGFTYLLGPEANQFVFAHSELFRWQQAMGFLSPVDGETSMLLSDGSDHRRRRRLVEPSLRHRRVAGYVPAMAHNADAVMAGWRAGQQVDAYTEFRAGIRRTTLEVLFGHRLAADADVLGGDLQLMLDLCDGLPQLVQAKQRFRTPEWRRAMAARERVDRKIFDEIARLRTAGPGSEPSVLDALVHGRDDEGQSLADNEIRDQAVTLIVAGYETTSAALAWALHGMLTTPGVWDAAAAEVRDGLGGAVPDSEHLSGLPYLNGAVQEALRLYAPVIVVARWAGEDFSFAGRTIRAGTTVVLSPYVTHRLGEIWPDPLRFLPERWIPASTHYRKPKPYEFLPFGGGPHRCVGAAMAVTELTVMLARILEQAELSPIRQRIRAESLVTMRPRRGLPVRYHPR